MQEPTMPRCPWVLLLRIIRPSQGKTQWIVMLGGKWSWSMPAWSSATGVWLQGVGRWPCRRRWIVVLGVE